MIEYKREILPNGLTLLLNSDKLSQLAAINILYKVGSRNESPERTGLSHLFEHLLFRGTERYPSYDEAMQSLMGENNAFTCSDYTDFYCTLPLMNLAPALELEADRMRNLALTTQALEAERKVVVEEFKQRYLNQPYGDHLMLLRSMCYKEHPYRWATIGLTPDHILGATMEEVRAFYDRYYCPSNAILSISANLPYDELREMAVATFGDIAPTSAPIINLPTEPQQSEARRVEVERKVPATCLTIAFGMGGRLSSDFYVADLVSDILAGGDSARLYQRLVKGRKIAASVNAYISGEVDPGLFIFTMQLLPECSVEQAEQAIWEEIELLKSERVGDYELEKVKNKFEAGTTFGELNVMNKAMNLVFYEMVGDIEVINREVAIFRAITQEQVSSFATAIFTRERSNTLVYRAVNNE